MKAGFQFILYGDNGLEIDSWFLTAAETIHSPGKFEGEMYHCPWLWNKYIINGFGDEFYDEDEQLYSAVDIDEDDVKNCPSLAGAKCAILWESDLGFVQCQTFESETEYEKARAEIEDKSDEEE